MIDINVLIALFTIPAIFFFIASLVIFWKANKTLNEIERLYYEEKLRRQKK